MARYSYSTSSVAGGGRIDCKLCFRSIIMPSRARWGFFVQVLDDVAFFTDAQDGTSIHQCESEEIRAYRCEVCDVDYPQAGALAWNQARRGRSWRPKCPDCGTQLTVGLLSSA